MKVLIVDDHVLFREGLVGLLENDSEFNVVGQASSVREAIDQAIKLKPDLVLMDFSMPHRCISPTPSSCRGPTRYSSPSPALRLPGLRC